MIQLSDPDIDRVIAVRRSPHGDMQSVDESGLPQSQSLLERLCHKILHQAPCDRSMPITLSDLIQPSLQDGAGTLLTHIGDSSVLGTL